MAETKAIKTALISVFHKDGLDEILRLLANDGVKFLSTGGTRSFIEEQGYSCDTVEDLTGYPSIFRITALYASTIGMMSAAIASDNATPIGSRTAPPKKTDTSCG